MTLRDKAPREHHHLLRLSHLFGLLDDAEDSHHSRTPIRLRQRVDGGVWARCYDTTGLYSHERQR